MAAAVQLNFEERTLVTGAPGFVAGWLIAELLSDGREVHGLGLVPGDGAPPRRYGDFTLAGAVDGLSDTFAYEGPDGSWQLTLCRLENAGALGAVLDRVAPTGIYHLAAQSSAGLSFAHPHETFAANVTGPLNLLEHLRALPADRRPRLVAVGSCEEYGAVATADEAPLREDAPLAPVSPYGVSKVAQTLLCRQYARSAGLDIVVARPFSHTGPGHDTRFAFPSFAAQIAEAEKAGAPATLAVGDLSPVRDFLDVRDVVRAYRLLMAGGRGGEIYNICSGRALTIRQGLDILLASASVPIGIRNDPDRMRPADIPYMVGDNTRLRETTGWRAEHRVADTLAELLELARKESQ